MSKAKNNKVKLNTIVSVKDYGAKGDGVSDDSASFQNPSTELFVPPGTYRIASNITITSDLVLSKGALLRPTTGVKVTISGSVQAGLYQVFDRSGGGTIEFGGSRIPEVFVEWWGALSGTGGRTDNDVPVQYAIDAVQSIIYSDFTTKAPNSDNNGGIVNFGHAADYLISGRIHTRDNVILRGKGQFTSLIVNGATWGSDTEIWLSQDGTGSQFNCRAENITFDCANNATCTRAIYAPAWQQGCGLRDVIVKRFRNRGVVFDNAYGGSVGFEMTNTLFTFDRATASNSVRCVDIDIEGVFSTGWLNVLLDNVQFESGNTDLTGIVGQTGIKARGRVKLAARAVHGEGLAYIVDLDTAASLYGNTISAGGNSSVLDVVLCQSTWSGRIDTTGMTKAGSSRLVRSLVASPTNLYRDADPVFGRVTYPHDPTQVLAYARNTAAGGTLDSNAWGFSSITRTGAGQYRLNFDTTKIVPAAGSAYRVRVDIGDFSGGGRTYYVSSSTTTFIELVFRNTSGVAADCDTFDVYLFGRPGV